MYFLHLKIWLYGKKALPLHDNLNFMKRSIVIMSLLSFLPFCSCASSGGDKSEAHIVSFSFSFDGTIGGNSHWYDVRVEDGKVIMDVDELEHRDYGKMTDTVSMDFLQELEALCAKHNVRKYDGFRGTDPHVCDGSGFSLSIRYDDGKRIYAHGMNDFPKGYRAFSDDLHELFAPYCERMHATALAKKKAEGVSGDLTFILAVVAQSGDAGSDKYEVMLSRADIRQYNVDVKVHSVSGEFFPKGDYKYITSVPDEAIDWKAFAKLVKKYNLVEWMDWEKHVVDYNNSEWFQLGLYFDEGHISAHGSAHPAHYDAFRKDFLKLLYKTVKDMPQYNEE